MSARRSLRMFNQEGRTQAQEHFAERRLCLSCPDLIRACVHK
jgi:hypothetical protein